MSKDYGGASPTREELYRETAFKNPLPRAHELEEGEAAPHDPSGEYHEVHVTFSQGIGNCFFPVAVINTSKDELILTLKSRKCVFINLKNVNFYSVELIT